MNTFIVFCHDAINFYLWPLPLLSLLLLLRGSEWAFDFKSLLLFVLGYAVVDFGVDVVAVRYLCGYNFGREVAVVVVINDGVLWFLDVITMQAVNGQTALVLVIRYYMEVSF